MGSGLFFLLTYHFSCSPSHHQFKQLHCFLICFLCFPGGVDAERQSDTLKSLGSCKGTFSRTGPGTGLLPSKHRQMPILIILMGSGRGNTLTVYCLLRTFEQPQVLASPGTSSSTYLLLFGVGCGSCWDSPGAP